MSFMKNLLFNLIAILGFWVFFFALYDIFTDQGWMVVILAINIVLLVLIFTLIIYSYSKKPRGSYSIEEFEKRLKGGLYHFKCSRCGGIFAIKKSKKNNKKPVKMTCPDCGVIGIIPSEPSCIVEEIPEKKSVKASFECKRCGEGVTIWAEGTDLYSGVSVFSCPFCGEKKPLKRF